MLVSLLDHFAKRSLDRHLMVLGAENDTSLYTVEGGLVTIMNWAGTTANRGTADLGDMIVLMRERMASLLSRNGHALQIVFNRDPEEAFLPVGAIVGRLQGQCQLLGLELGDVLGEREALLTATTSWEQCYLVLYSHPSLVSDDETDKGGKTAAEVGRPRLFHAQTAGEIAGILVERHDTFCQSILHLMAEAGQQVHRLSVQEQGAILAAGLTTWHQADPGKWQPRLLAGGQRITGGERLVSQHMPTTTAQLQGRDMSFLGLEQMGRQLARDRVRLLPDGVMCIGDRVLAGFDLALAPELVLPFNDLLNQCLDGSRPFRWRMSWLLEPGGFQGRILHRAISEIFTFLSHNHNSRIRDAFRNLEALDGQEDTVVRLRVCFALWGEGDKIRDLRNTMAAFRRSIERWGNARTDTLTGDPMGTIVASMPGNGLSPTAPPMAVPLKQALALLPLNRPVSPWPEGPVTLKTPDGRLWPYQSGSSLQDSWCDLIIGTPGSGKSVLLNTMNLGALLTPNPNRTQGRTGLPLVGIIDIGSSASGLVELIGEALPEESRHQVQMARLSNDRSQAINIFDLEIGCRHPMPLELTFQINFLQLLLADAGEDAVRLSGLLRELVLDAYRFFSDRNSPKHYTRGEAPDIDLELSEGDHEVDEHTTWYELVDHFSDAGDWVRAEEAQRRAVPLLTDLPVILRRPDLQHTYREMGLLTGERVLPAMARLINEAVATWPLLCHPTRFGMAGARLRVIDLQDVTERGATQQARRRSALMYLLARHVVCRGFFLHHDDIKGLNVRPSQKRRLEEEANQNRELPKRLCFDEFHRTGGLPGVVNQMETDIREGRKHNVQVTLASQLIGDFSGVIHSLATGLWICSTFTENEIGNLQGILGLDEMAVNTIRYRLGRPTPSGASVYVSLKTHAGDVRQLLINHPPATELWAYSTTAEDVALRRNLTARMGGREARRILGRKFPGGSARSEIQRRRSLFVEMGQQTQIIEELADELVNWAAVQGSVA
ncbi:MAG: hypothetical protein OXH65_03010 [Paracoccaceae bacterium]|nr:hypothetical protein [Paracoccaceae bacterium]